MNIVMLSTFDINGGASIAAYRLLKGFRMRGHDARMIVRNKDSDDPAVIRARIDDPLFEKERKVFQSIQRGEINRNRSPLSDTWFSIPYPGYDLSGSEIIKECDIINLHWMAEFQSVETLTALLDTDKPVIWTLHDENAYTGGCHYTGGCQKYEIDCQNCSQLKEDRFQIPFHNLANKINLWGDRLVLVTPSQWLAKCVKKSRLFNKSRVEVIPNSLETDIFKPIDKRTAKRNMGWSPNAVTLLFGAHTANEKRKGFNHLVQAMEFCKQNSRLKQMIARKQLQIVTFGPPQGDLKNLGFDVCCTGYIRDNIKLAQIYSAADIFVLPSLEDNLPNTMLEAMACGAPVAGFDIGGLPDMVQNGVTGYLAPHFNNRQLGAFLLSMILNSKKRQFMSQECRKLIETKHRLEIQADQYLDLFHDLLKRKKNAPANQQPFSAFKSDTITAQWNRRMQKYFIDIFNHHSQHPDTSELNPLKSRQDLYYFLKKIKGKISRLINPS